jgi:hypothetical protein
MSSVIEFKRKSQMFQCFFYSLFWVGVEVKTDFHVLINEM